jgi:hypothetical protein
MALSETALDLFRKLAAITEAVVVNYRSELIASNTLDTILQRNPVFVTDRPDTPILSVLRSRTTIAWRQQLIASYVPHSGWFIESDEHPVKKQLVTELLAVLKGYPCEDQISQRHLESTAHNTLSQYINQALSIYHALVFRLGEDHRERALMISTDMIDERINLQRATHFSGSFLYNFELEQPGNAPIKLDDDLEIRLSKFADIACLALFDNTEGKYLPPPYILVFRQKPHLLIYNALPIFSADPTPIKDALTALRLCKNEYVGGGREWQWTSGLPAAIGYGSHLPDSMVYSIIKDSVWDLPPYQLRTADIQEVTTVYQQLRRSPGRSKLEVALSRFNTSYGRADYRERIIDLVIALENLFGEETIGQTTEVGYRLRMRAARYLGNDACERKHLRKFISQLYTLRSKIVHGDPKANNEEIQKSFKRPTDEVITELIEIVRRSIRMLLANPQHIGHEHFNDLLLGIVD